MRLLIRALVGIASTLVTNDHGLLRAAAIQGLGIALLSDMNCARALADGRLARVLEGEVGHDVGVWVLVAQRTLAPARVRAFMDALSACFVLDLGAVDAD